MLILDTYVILDLFTRGASLNPFPHTPSLISPPPCSYATIQVTSIEKSTCRINNSCHSQISKDVLSFMSLYWKVNPWHDDNNKV